MLDLLPFREVWALDFEFRHPEGERVEQVHCMVACELRSGRYLHLSAEQLDRTPPFDTGPDAVFVAYMAAAEAGCFLALGWPLPVNVIDCYVEFLSHTNGLDRPFGTSLGAAMQAYRLPAVDVQEKAEMRALAIRGAPFTETERRDLIAYCQSDVDALALLLQAMLPRILQRRGRDMRINLVHALLRGRYMVDVARMEYLGIPVDGPLLARITEHWGELKVRLITDVDRDYDVFDGATFKMAKFQAYVERVGLLERWPRTEQGALSLESDNFRDMAKACPVLAPLHELRSSLSQLRLTSLTVGGDGRHRTSLRPFASRTSRNQPSSNRFVFGPATWIRSLIRPEPGTVLAYLDWSAQEFGIAAALSGDEAMQADYASDPYIGFAKRIGRAPPDATKLTHGEVRDQMKIVVLATNYGMQAQGLARRLGVSIQAAGALLAGHRRAYARFAAWTEAVIDHARLRGYTETVFGWNFAANHRTNQRSIANYPVQANGAEMMRLAVHDCLAAGIRVVAPIHDALLVEASEDEAAELIPRAGWLMRRASGRVLSGFEIRVGGLDPASWVRYPNRYTDPRGQRMWELVVGLVAGGVPTPLPTYLPTYSLPLPPSF